MQMICPRFMKNSLTHRFAELWLLTSFGFLAPFPAITGARAQEPRSVYFGTGAGDSKGIYRANFDSATGKLTAATLAAEIGSPGFLALSPDGNRLYAVGNFPGGPGVAGYSVGPDGSLTPINTSPTGDGGASHVAVHPSGKFLLTAQYGGGSVALFPLEEGGKLGAAQLSRHEGGSGVVRGRQEKPHPHWCGFSPDGAFALVPDLGLDAIVVYRLKTDSTVPSMEAHAKIAVSPGSGPRHMRFSVDGKWIFLLNELSLTVTTLSWDAATGTAKVVGSVPTLSEEAKAKEVANSAAEILVHANGRFVYSSNRGHDSVTVFRAEPGSGALQVVEVEPIRGAIPRNINLDPSGRWLLAAGADSNTVSVFRIDEKVGELTFLPKGVINVPSPICILFGK